MLRNQADLEAASAEAPSTGASPFSTLELAVNELLQAVNSAASGQRASAHAAIRRVASMLQMSTQILNSDVGRNARPRISSQSRTGLAPWQIRKVQSHIAQHLGAAISIQDLATLANLSRYHFSRAFRDSFGYPPHRYLSRRRVEHAQSLMLTTDRALAEIALDCGLVDQAHFSKLFRRLVGETPGAWRRARLHLQ